MRRKLLLGITLLFALCATSCSDDGDSTPEPTTPITGYDEWDLAQEFYANETSTSYFDFTATEPWTIDISEVTKSDDLWVEVTPMSGDAGEHRISITVTSQNPTEEERSIDITITGESGDSPITISVTQNISVDVNIALENIYYNNGGKEWTDKENWCSLKPLSEWYGVTVDDSGNVTHLSLIGNNLTGDLDVSGLPYLTSLLCSSNELTSINASGCSRLESLYCVGNQLTSINVNGCSNLTNLSCTNNQLTALDVGECSSLTNLICGWNLSLPTLDVSGCGSSLKILTCHSCNLSSLNLSGCSVLEYLYCGGMNPFTTIDVSDCISLTNFNVECDNLETIYSSSVFPVDMIDEFYYTSWGDRDSATYTEPSHKNGYQYPMFIYK